MIVHEITPNSPNGPLGEIVRKKFQLCGSLMGQG